MPSKDPRRPLAPARKARTAPREGFGLLDRRKMSGIEHHRSCARDGGDDALAMFRRRRRDVLRAIDHEERRLHARELILDLHSGDRHAAGGIAFRIGRQHGRPRAAEERRLPVAEALREEAAEHRVDHGLPCLSGAPGPARSRIEIGRHLRGGVRADDASRHVRDARLQARAPSCRPSTARKHARARRPPRRARRARPGASIDSV